MYVKIMPWRRGAVDNTSPSGTGRPGFESRQGIRFLRKHSSAVMYKMPCLRVARRNKGIGHKNILKFK
jgi:hypothetical protein